MIIPDKIRIFAEDVIINKTDLLKRDNSYGVAHYRYNEIQIDENLEKGLEEATFFHEVTHFVLNKMCEDEINNEKFVCVFSSLLNQALKDCLK